MIGVGNRFRGDDAAGIEVVRRLRERGVDARESEGEPVGLLDCWEGAGAAVVVDAVRSGAPAGTIHRVDASEQALPAILRGSTSTHAVGLGEAIELARTLGQLPPRIVVYGIEGASFAAGEELSPQVGAVLDEVVDRVIEEVGT